MCNSYAINKHLLLIFMALLVLSCALALVKPIRMRERRTRSRWATQPTLLKSTKNPGSGANHVSAVKSFDVGKSPESNFWISITQKNETNRLSNVPAIHRLDKESGPLPPGAYYNVEKGLSAPCLVSVGIQPPSNAHDREDAWREGVKNCHSLIDCGFNTFRINSPESHVDRVRRKSKSISWFASNHMTQRKRAEMRYEAETNFYHTLRKNTPSSVLRTCHFMVNIEIPSILCGDPTTLGQDKGIPCVPYGNGWMVRESVSQALLRTKGECLDSVILEYCEYSPYHLDVLDTLFEMKREGLIHRVLTENFPHPLLKSAFGCGFIVGSEVCGNLMNSNNLRSNSDMGILLKDYESSRLISSPLGGGLFTNQHHELRDWTQMSLSSRNTFKTLFKSLCGASRGRVEGDDFMDIVHQWNRYRTIMNAVMDISLKHQVSVESVALRWLLQLNDGDSISVGTHLGMDFPEEKGRQPYNRHKDLRQVFTFSLGEDDMEFLCRVSGMSEGNNLAPGRAAADEIDFTNKALWM